MKKKKGKLTDEAKKRRAVIQGAYDWILDLAFLDDDAYVPTRFLHADKRKFDERFRAVVNVRRKAGRAKEQREKGVGE